MELNNISLWFAKNESNEIVTIDKINEDYEGKYYCPLCGSEIIPKAIHSKEVSPHFAHIDRSKCSGESIIHYWVKNELMKKGDVFEVVTDKSAQHICKEILFEQSYNTPYGIYRPDITVITYKDEKIFIEVNYTNKKKVEDYYLKWKHLCCTVVEFGVSSVYDGNENKIKISNSFKSIYYNGMPIDKNSKSYIDYKRNINVAVPKHIEEQLLRSEWFIDDIYRYITDRSVDIDCLMSGYSFLIKDECEDMLEILYRSSKCQEAMKSLVKERDERAKEICNLVVKEISSVSCATCGEFSNERLIRDRLFSKYKVVIQKKQIHNRVLPPNGLFSYSDCSYHDKIEVDITSMELEVVDVIKEKVLEFEKYLKEEYANRKKIENFILIHGKVKNIIFYKNYENKNKKFLSFENGSATFKIYNDGIISINDLNICSVNIDNIDELHKGIEFALSYSRGKNVIFPDNIVNIYIKLSDIYSSTNNKYEITLDRYYISISTMYNEELCSYAYNDKTTVEELIDIFSASIRNYVYGGKN